jgi:hypothetical protein
LVLTFSSNDEHEVLAKRSSNHLGDCKPAGMLDIPIDLALAAMFHQTVIELMEHGIEISHLAPNIDLAEAMIAPSHVTLGDALRRCGTETLDGDSRKFVAFTHSSVCSATREVSSTVQHLRATP